MARHLAVSFFIAIRFILLITRFRLEVENDYLLTKFMTILIASFFDIKTMIKIASLSPPIYIGWTIVELSRHDFSIQRLLIGIGITILAVFIGNIIAFLTHRNQYKQFLNEGPSP